MNANESFVALVIYPTRPDAQAGQMEKLIRLSAERVRNLPGFRGGRILVSEDGANLVTITEWRDREAFEQFRDSEVGRNAIRFAAELHPKAYWLVQQAVVDAP
jgi:heme-degrading monooxygenase HmoA